MSESHRRKKQPEETRRRLLQVAVQILLEEGIPALSLDAVARRVGVTKGGLLHHFPSREALLQGLFDHLLEQFEKIIVGFMEQDHESYGRFTRAYLRAVLQTVEIEKNRGGMPIYLAVMAEPPLRDRMQAWFRGHYRKLAESDPMPLIDAEILRLAADGLWLSETIAEKRILSKNRQLIIRRLIDMSYAGNTLYCASGKKSNGGVQRKRRL